MDFKQVLQELRSERDRIAAAIDALETLDGNPAPVVVTSIAAPHKRRLSAAGRRRIIAATKARWAKIRAAENSDGLKSAKGATAPQSKAKPRPRVMSAAARRRISTAAKARWAAAKAKGRTRL